MVYPHLRGADVRFHSSCQNASGVSPPAWGRRLRFEDEEGWYRCIPTCVGQTFLLTIIRINMTVYPHLRGADLAAAFGIPQTRGVSPPAWGRRC